MNRKVLIGVVALVALAAFLGYRTLTGSDAEELLRISGNIEATDVDLSFKIPGRIAERNVEEGEFIRAGQPIARLDEVQLFQEAALSRAEVAAAQAALRELLAGARLEEIAEAEAAVAQAEALLAELLAGSRTQEIAAQQAILESAQAEVERLTNEHERQRSLYEKGVVSRRDFEAAQTALRTSAAREKEARERLTLLMEGPRPERIEQTRQTVLQARHRLALLLKGPRPETVDQARARLEQARQAQNVAETRLAYARITSPIEGIVLSENLKAGMYAAAGAPVVTVGDLANVWLRGYISETDLGRVKTGQRALVTTDSYPDKPYEGRVSFISSQAEFTPKSVQTARERVRLVYRVKIDIPNPHLELKPGMPADAEIVLDPAVPRLTRDDASKPSLSSSLMPPSSDGAAGSPERGRRDARN
jgi:HlyD family secretion protein